MSPLMQIFIGLTIGMCIFLGYLWRTDSFVNVLVKFTLIGLAVGWAIHLLVGLGYIVKVH